MFPPSKPPQKPHAPPPENEGGWGRILGWVVILAGLAAIGWMIANHYAEPRLICQNKGQGRNSLIEMGTCTEE